ncbi:DUF2007 domain-containing protein [Flavobacterium piscinae]|uniref:DUF2007 domain-containing protein n=1 Tax=Flavobacterium piscinae TaxID=2506424 RepID=A0A4Q1KW22_9FLAO|nr:DUF2007 domain-containing protein [Flavobacterium piscinae]RXR33639.1 DUF2007 domain-containing protein [Flavobacterium piscinae]
MKDFVTVAVFTLPTEIAVLKTVLENEGIQFFFENETIVSIDPFASIAYGGIKLKVHQNDVEVVRNIIDNLESHLRIVE